MKVMVKICGLSTEASLDAALAAGADMVGFVFYEKSPRHVPLAIAAKLAERAGRRAAKVLLTVDAEDALLAALIGAVQPQILQVHGSETPGRIGAVRARFGMPVMKAIRLAKASDLAEIERFETIADFLLFDAKPAPEKGLPGGNGNAFDWSLLSHVKPKKPWLLAGGLDVLNVAEALDKTHAPGVDVSSGVESAIGVKDEAKIEAFIKEVRRVETEPPLTRAAARRA